MSLKAKLLTNLAAERERIEHLASLTGMADIMRYKGASQHSIQTVLDGYDEYFRFTCTPSATQPCDPSDPSPDPVAQDGALPLSAIKSQPLTWLWPGRIPLGHLTLLDGEPGSGTSLLALTLAACISSGQPLPVDTPDTSDDPDDPDDPDAVAPSTPAPLPTLPGNVVLIAPYDHASQTITPRLQAAGGDPSHVFLLNTVETVASTPTVSLLERPFCLADDLDLLETTITRHHATLVIIDPLHAVLTPARTRSSSPRPSTRTLLASLAHLAKSTGCAILLVRPTRTRPSNLRHPRPSGSLDLVSLARSALLLASDPADEQTHLLLPTKHSLSPKPAILSYNVVAHASGVPVIDWRGSWQAPISPDSDEGRALSAQHGAIETFLIFSDLPANAREIATSTGYDYECVRKMLQRLTQQGKLVSPSRGLYTYPDHPCLETTDTDLEPSPSPLDVPNVPSMLDVEMDLGCAPNALQEERSLSSHPPDVHQANRLSPVSSPNTTSDPPPALVEESTHNDDSQSSAMSHVPIVPIPAYHPQPAQP